MRFPVCVRAVGRAWSSAGASIDVGRLGDSPHLLHGIALQVEPRVNATSEACNRHKQLIVSQA